MKSTPEGEPRGQDYRDRGTEDAQRLQGRVPRPVGSSVAVGGTRQKPSLQRAAERPILIGLIGDRPGSSCREPSHGFDDLCQGQTKRGQGSHPGYGEVLNQLDTGGRSQEIDRPSLIEPDRRTLQPLFGLPLGSQDICCLRENLGEFPCPPALLLAKWLGRRILSALPRPELIPTAFSRDSVLPMKMRFPTR
jgi:hypothetical protein